MEKLKSWWPHLVWMLAGLVLLINPAHIDKIAAAHPGWDGIILAVWAAVLAWALKIRPKPEPPAPGPVAAQQQQNSRYTGGSR